MPKLTALKVKAAKHPGGTTSRPVRIGDEAGLYLQISPAGTKSWLFRYMLAGRSREMGLGSVGDGPGHVSLAAARLAAGEARALARAGTDPIDRRKVAQQDADAAVAKAQANTFSAVAARYIEAHKAGWRNAKHADQWKSTLVTYADPTLGTMPVEAIRAADVLAVLSPIWTTKPETASRVRGRIEAVLDYAAAHDLRPRGANPAAWRGGLKGALPARSKVATVRHHPALPYQQIGAFMAALATREGTSARALAFAILTAARSGEVMGAAWREVDLEAMDWTIPAVRMKGKREHRVPLSSAAVAILRHMEPLATGSDALIFPGERKGRPLSPMALDMLLRRMNAVEDGETPPWRDRFGETITPHGFRSTFRDWTAEATAFPHEMAEAALAHAVRNQVEAAYRRGDLFDKRRRMMDAWATFCATPSAPGKVLPLRRTG